MGYIIVPEVVVDVRVPLLNGTLGVLKSRMAKDMQKKLE